MVRLVAVWLKYQTALKWKLYHRIYARTQAHWSLIGLQGYWVKRYGRPYFHGLPQLSAVTLSVANFLLAVSPPSTLFLLILHLLSIPAASGMSFRGTYFPCNNPVAVVVP